MAVKKTRLSKPSKKSAGLNNKVRFDFGKKAFVVVNKKRKAVGAKTFKNHGEALEYAVSLETK
jgi:hypothetical protein